MTLQIKEGHFYRRGDGEIVGPAKLNANCEWVLPHDKGEYIGDYDNDAWLAIVKSGEDLVEDLGTMPSTGTDSMYNFADDKCCQCGSTELEIVDWKQGHMCADCLRGAVTENLEGGPKGATKHDSGKPDVALRDNKGKVDPSFLHPAFLWYLARVGHEGGWRYIRGGKANYLKGGKPLSEYYSSALRHISLAMAGEWLDDVSGERHLAHAAWNCLMACYAKEFGILSEDDTLPTADIEKFKALLKMEGKNDNT